MAVTPGGAAVDTVKRNARRSSGGCNTRRNTASLTGPRRDHLRKRRAKQPKSRFSVLLREIRELSYQGSSNLLVRDLKEGPHEGEPPAPVPRQGSTLLLTRAAGPGRSAPRSR